MIAIRGGEEDGMIEVAKGTWTVGGAGTRHLALNEVMATHQASVYRTLDGIPLLGMAMVRMALAGAGRAIGRGMHLLQEL